MVLTVQITLPYPPSVNTIYVMKRGGITLSEAYRVYRDQVRYTVYSIWHRSDDSEEVRSVPMITGPCEMAIDIYRPRRVGDIDNVLKALLDSIQGLLIANDKHVERITVERFDDRLNPRVELIITQRQSSLSGEGTSKVKRKR